MTIGTSTVCLIHLPMGPFTLWPWLSQCSARCRLLRLHLWSKPGWNQNHYHSKCVICLPYIQITVLCSRRHVTGCGMEAALSPTPELSRSADCICPRMAECAFFHSSRTQLRIFASVNGPSNSRRRTRLQVRWSTKGEIGKHLIQFLLVQIICH